VEAAHWDAAANRWRIRTSTDASISAQHCIMASGCLSVPKAPDIPGAGRFQGPVYSTGRWPHQGVDFTGKRVAVIGTGSSGVQSIPLIAEQAAQLTVFQRTPNYSIPAGNGPVAHERRAPLEADRDAYRLAAKWSRAGVPSTPTQIYGRYSPPDVHAERFESAWKTGELIPILGVFADQILFPDSNAIVAGKVREKIRAVVHNPETADLLSPKDHHFGTKRPCLDTGYYQTYNRPNVRLVDLRTRPIASITETGIDVAGESMTFDAIVYATGFDAMTGAIVAVDITGRDGVTLKAKWAAGPITYLGLISVGFPNFFTITGPGSPSVLSNMMVSIEQHVDWMAECIATMQARQLTSIEPTAEAENAWVQTVHEVGHTTLYPHVASWYTGANIPGKQRLFTPYAGGVGTYRRICEQVVEQNYEGFEFKRSA